MARPSIFTAIDYKDTKTGDGGVVRNFPARCDRHGANYTIGVNYLRGWGQPTRLNSAIDIYTRLLFIKMRTIFRSAKLCNILIEPPWRTSLRQFGSSAELHSTRERMGKEIFRLLKIGDSLRAVIRSIISKKAVCPTRQKVTIVPIHIKMDLAITTESRSSKDLHLEIGRLWMGLE